MGYEGRSAGCRFAEIGDYAYERSALDSVFDALSTELGHPRTPSLARTWEEIGIEQCKVTAIFISDLIDFHILVVAGNVFTNLEIDSVETVGKVENGINAVFQFEIRLEKLLAQIVFRFLEFF